MNKKVDICVTDLKKSNQNDLHGVLYPHLVNDLYAVSHFNPHSTDSTPYGPTINPKEVSVNLADEKIIYGGPVNIMTLAAEGGDNPNRMWQVGTNGISYINTETWRPICQLDVLAEYFSSSYEELEEENYEAFVADCDANVSNIHEMKNTLRRHFGTNYITRFGNGLYAVVGAGNVLYVQYGTSIFAFTFNSSLEEIELIGELPNAAETIMSTNPTEEIDNYEDSVGFVGLSLNSDGIVVATLNIGIALIHPSVFIDGDTSRKIYFAPFLSSDNRLTAETSSAQQQPIAFDTFESISNSICIDDDNAIYVASTVTSQDGSTCLGYLRKLTVTHYGNNATVGKIMMAGVVDNNLNEIAEATGAWITPYETSNEQDPPVIKRGRGTGSTPTLMGDGENTFVVMTNGAKQMELVAYWRDVNESEIILGNKKREADRIKVSCGFDDNLPSGWAQSEQSVVVNGYGAFVVNNIPSHYNPQMTEGLNLQNNLLQACMVGPYNMGPTGVEKFVWDVTESRWKSTVDSDSAWNNPEIPSTSTVPIYCENSNMVIVTGWEGKPGLSNGNWVVQGFDWDTGARHYKLNFGPSMRGNGAYSIPQFLQDGSMIFNSIIGPVKITNR